MVWLRARSAVCGRRPQKDEQGESLWRRYFQARVAGPIHLTHPARTKRRQNLVEPQVCARSEGHKCDDYSLSTALGNFLAGSVLG